jgi:hypothetical protein
MTRRIARREHTSRALAADDGDHPAMLLAWIARDLAAMINII